jgi:rare lipoprotein A
MTTTRRPSDLLKVAVLALAAVALPSCAAVGKDRTTTGRSEAVRPSAGPRPAAKAGKGAGEGIASIYTDRRTASGERFSAAALAAAHRTMPFGSRARVTNLKNGRTVVVRINDRGPYTRGRIIDLTPAAAERIGLTRRQGITKVRVEPLES